MTQKNNNTLLIVDDESTNIAVLNAILSPQYQVKVALNGPDAIKIASLTQPNLILLDIIMEDMDGFSVCKALKSESQTQNIPIIFVTGLTDQQTERKALEYGAVDIFNKPYSAPLLLKRLENHFLLASYQAKLR